MCATWMKEPCLGPEIIDLSILPPFAGLLFFCFCALGLAGTQVRGVDTKANAIAVRTSFAVFLRCDFLPKVFGFHLIGEHESNVAFLKKA